MMRAIAFGILICSASPCLAQRVIQVPVAAPPQVQAPVDTSSFATKTAVQTAQTIADQAKAAADLAKSTADAAKNAVPSTCTQPPAPDAMTATAGTGTPCTPRIDAARQTPIPPASATTVSGGTFSGNWNMTLPTPPTRAIATVEGTVPYHCQIITKTVTGFAGRCWLVNTNATLPSTLTGLVSYSVPLLTDSAAGVQVTILARQ